MTPQGDPRKHRKFTEFGGQLQLPAELVSALGESEAARTRFDALPSSQQREYADWIGAARRADSRERRAAQAVMRLLEQSD